MKLRRRILRYFILLILLTSAVNLAISYFLTQASWDRFHGIFRSAFLQQTKENLLTAYEGTHSLAAISESAIRPRELVIQLPRRFGRENDKQITVPVPADGGWNIVLADETGRFLIGADKAAVRVGNGTKLMSETW